MSNPIMRMALFLTLVTLGIAIGGDAAAQSATACDAARALEVAVRIQSHYDSVRDLRADFEQISRSVVLSGASLGEEVPTRGEVVFSKPGKMRWSYREPEPSLVVSNGETLWIYDVGARQASKLPVDQGYLAGAALQFLLGEGRLVDSFKIEATRCEPGFVELELTPREAASYEQLGLRANPETGEIDETAIVDLFGNRTLIRFLDMKINLDPAGDVFEFSPPKGVDVVDLGAPS